VRGAALVGHNVRITRRVRDVPPDVPAQQLAGDRHPIAGVASVAMTVSATMTPAGLAAIAGRYVGNLVGATVAANVLGYPQVVTIAGLVEGDPTSDAAKVERDTLAAMRRVFPPPVWTDVRAIPYVESNHGMPVHGPRDFWVGGQAFVTRTREAPEGLVDWIGKGEENPVGPTPARDPNVIAAMATDAGTAAQRIAQAGGEAARGVVREVGTQVQQGLRDAQRAAEGAGSLGAGLAWAILKPVLWVLGGTVVVVGVGTVVYAKSTGQTVGGAAKSLGLKGVALHPAGRAYLAARGNPDDPGRGAKPLHGVYPHATWNTATNRAELRHTGSVGVAAERW
jgi:hypothetical protein